MQLTTEQQKTLDRIRLFAGSGVNNPKWALELLDIIATLQSAEPPVTDERATDTPNDVPMPPAHLPIERQLHWLNDSKGINEKTLTRVQENLKVINRRILELTVLPKVGYEWVEHEPDANGKHGDWQRKAASDGAE